MAADEKKLRMVYFAVDHAEDYRCMTKTNFNALLSEFCAANLGLTIKDPLGSVQRAQPSVDGFEAARQRSTGTAMQATALQQALAKWREVQYSRTQARRSRAQTRSNAADEGRAVANELSADMVASPSTRRQRREDTGGVASLASVIKDAVKELRTGNGIRQQRQQHEQDNRRARELPDGRLADVEKGQVVLKRKLDTLSESQESMQQQLRQQTAVLRALVAAQSHRASPPPPRPS
ncbi:hypothetical protein KEM52_005312 [Ascosphaera acerosa]|nr:hypothetical protein KEM52_005312 [Ascosphaera acerosa]